MKKLLDKAQKAEALDPTARKMACEVAEAGNDVLHEKQTSPKRAYETLVKMRRVIQHLYRKADKLPQAPASAN